MVPCYVIYAINMVTAFTTPKAKILLANAQVYSDMFSLFNSLFQKDTLERFVRFRHKVIFVIHFI